MIDQCNDRACILWDIGTYVGVSGVPLGYRVDGGRGGVNLDVLGDRDSQARVIFFAGG